MSAHRDNSLFRLGQGRFRFLVAGGLAAFIATTALAEKPRYMLHDIGTLGGPNSAAVAMNDGGIVVGWSEWSEETGGTLEVHAFAWDNGRMIDLLTLGGDWAVARDVNNRGEIVGVSATSEGVTHAFYAFEGVMYDLNELLPVVAPDELDSRVDLGTTMRLKDVFEVSGINDDGHIVGCGTIWGSDEIHGFLFVPITGLGPGAAPPSRFFDIVPLGRLPGAADCIPYDINNHDAVVGESGSDAFYWDRHVMRLDYVARDSSCATALNDEEHAVGWTLVDGVQKATRWFKGNRINLDPRDDRTSSALDINETMHIVGWTAPTIGAEKTATIWLGAGPPVRLDMLTDDPGTSGVRYVRFDEAVAIDEQNRIAGTGSITFGRSRAFVLIPIEIGFDDEKFFIETWSCGN